MIDGAKSQESLSSLLDQEQPLLLPGIYDGLSLLLAERHGFRAALLSGGGLSESRLGCPDVGLMTPETSIQACQQLVPVTRMSLLADGDTGYGNGLNVHHVTHSLEAAGAGGVFFEDQEWPKRCGHLGGKRVVPASTMLERLRGALAARQDESFLIMARTDAASVLSVEHAIDRANQYLQEGADIVFPDALESRADIELFCQRVDGRICLNMGFGVRDRPTTPLLSRSELAELGVSMVLYPRLLTASAVRGMEYALAALNAAGPLEVLERPDLAASLEELSDLMRLSEYLDLESKLGGSSNGAYGLSPSVQ